VATLPRTQKDLPGGRGLEVAPLTFGRARLYLLRYGPHYPDVLDEW
jgi:hypothetical protein